MALMTPFLQVTISDALWAEWCHMFLDQHVWECPKTLGKKGNLGTWKVLSVAGEGW